MNIESTLMNLGFFYVLNEIWFILNIKKMMYDKTLHFIWTNNEL